MDAFSIFKLDDLIHSRLRLGIMAFLSTAGSADFNTLKKQLQTTDGNLSVQIRKLEDANYVEVEKSFIGKKPNTKITLTEKGRRAFIDYLDQLKKILP